MNPAFRDYNERTEQMEKVLRNLRSEGLFPALQGWRDEYFEVKSERRALLKMERAATPLFGVRKYGVDINGYVRHPTHEYVFDLELPLDFVPPNSDGEVQAFELLPAKERVERVFTPDFKTTSAPVVIDFLIRHGHITADDVVDFTQIVELLHVPLQSLYTYKARLELAQKHHHNLPDDAKNCHCGSLQKKSVENGHKKAA
ncbi:hypothetical protein M5D96_008846 [Drosophila gunungcola]|uniref:DUF4743 domain-containing protein n=1 Tax=Drosophila gunungcola TaxID=103775 RepID=A0A9P9YJM5_9MUSC|nr:hypothetical protein M5D96_008846 [Drosophila gunungcola]